jgi:acyl-CoA synthetase (AMP-forming)/AMP-acid ligase II
MGTFAAGLTATLVSPALTSKEIAWVLKNSQPRVIITATSCQDAMLEAIRSQQDRAAFDAIPIYTVDVATETYPSKAPSVHDQHWTRLLADPSLSATNLSFDPKSRVAVILWSSGTSGRSKGVLLSHESLGFSVASLWHDSDFYLKKPQRWLGYVPFYHVFGLVNLFLLAIPAPATVYIMSAFKLDAMLASVPRRRITYLHMAPPIAVMLAKSPLVEPYARRDATGLNKFASVVGGVTGGAPLGHEIVLQVHSRLGFRIRLGYGLTEACSVTLQPGMGEEAMKEHVGDSGSPHWGVELMIAREGPAEEIPKHVSTGESGEILIRSKGLMVGYLPFGGSVPGAEVDMSPTKQVLTPDGWFRTGDVGNIDKDGALHITDRIKELIKVRGFQVPPAELEAVLCGSSEVADAGVVSVYDATEATEWPRAFVVPSDTLGKPEDLKALAHRLRELVEGQTARYKWLRGGIVFVKQIPKSPSGKILRRVIRDGNIKGYEVSVYEPRARAVKL